MTGIFELCDDLGPSRVIHVHEPSVGLRGILVVDNVACGPSIGGLRMAPDVSLDECYRLARAMTMKNAAAGLPHGGGKSVVFGDPKMPRERKEPILRAFARALGGVQDYIFGPDMGTNEQCMAWVRDEIGRAVGLPREVGGIPLDEIGATAWGVRHAVEIALRHQGRELRGTRFVVEGYGAVGLHAARFLAAEGAVLVGASDSRGAVVNADGLDAAALAVLKAEGRSVAEHPGGQRLPKEGLLGVDCDVWIPAARPDVITAANETELKAGLVAPGANIAVTPDAEHRLHARGVICLPDFIANAGGVICAALEYRGVSEGGVFPVIEEKVARNTDEVLQRSAAEGIPPREAAVAMAAQRVRRAMDGRRFSLTSGAPGAV